MPSVIVSWSGRCRNRHVQENLCQKLRELGELSHSYFRRRLSIDYFNHPIEGNIIIDPALINTNSTCPKLKREIHEYYNKNEQDAYKLAKVLLGVSRKPRKKKDTFFRLGKVNLYGIEFQLFDPRKLYPGDDRISFVFLRDDECKDLDGLLVRVNGHNECRHYKSEIIKQADWFLQNSHIHLRYYLEEWIDKLLSWVKYFYIRNLWYARYERLSGYDDFVKLVDEYDLGQYKKERVRDTIFDMIKSELKDSLESSVINWGTAETPPRKRNILVITHSE